MLSDQTQLIFPSSGSSELALNFAPRVLRCCAAGPGGRPLTVLIDTGTDPSAIDLQLARRLGLRLGEFALGSDAASDAIPFTETMLPWLRLGDLEVRNLYALAVDLRAAPFPVDLVLGYNVLARLVLQVDYLRQRIKFSHADLGQPAAPAGGALLPLTFFEHFPALADVTLDGRLHLPLVTIDTGSNGGLTLGPDLALRAGLNAADGAVAQVHGNGFGSDTAVLRKQARLLRLGPFALYDVDLDTPGAGPGELQRAGRANLGNALLARFARVTLDYERRLCALEL